MPLLKLSARPLEKGRRSSVRPWMGRQPAGDAITQTRTSGHLPKLEGARLYPQQSSPNATKLTLPPRLRFYKSESLLFFLGSMRWKMKSHTNLSVNEIRRKIRTSRSLQRRCITLGVFMAGPDCRSVTLEALMISQTTRYLKKLRPKCPFLLS